MNSHELIFLGTGNAFGHGGRRHSSYAISTLINQKKSFLLIDCGPSTLPALHENNVDPKSIDYIYLSHLHPDHWLGLPLLVLDNKWITKRNDPIQLICPQGTEDLVTKTCELLYSRDEADAVTDTYHFIEIGNQTTKKIDDRLSVETLPAIHGGNGRMGILTFNGESIGYSGDSAFFEPSFLRLINCKIAIHEASSFNQPIPNHTTLSEILHYKTQIRGQLFLTHVDVTVTENSQIIEPPIFLAEDNMRIQF